MYECCQHCCRGRRGGGSACQCSDLTPHTASNWSAWLLSQKKASSKDDAQESPQQFAEDKQLRTWITGSMFCGLMRPRFRFRWCQACVAANRWWVTKTSVSCLQSSMGVGVLWSGAAWVLPALGSYRSLREPWMPTCTVVYWSRAWSPPFGDWAAGQYSNMITTTCLA